MPERQRGQGVFTVVTVLAAAAVVLATSGHGASGRDAVPLVVAPRSEVPYGLGQEFVASSCELLVDCRAVTPFVSPPPALPAAWLLSVGGVAGMQVAGLLALGACVHRLRGREWSLILAAPIAATVFLGQTTPILALAVVATPGWLGLLLALASAFKVTPALLVVPLLLHRRWLDLATFAGTLLALLVASLWWGEPVALWASWASSVEMLWQAVGESDANLALPTWGRALAAVALCAGWWVWRRDFTASWRLGWALWPMLLPLTWWHYGWVTVMAAGLAVRHDAWGERGDWLRRRLRERPKPRGR